MTVILNKATPFKMQIGSMRVKEGEERERKEGSDGEMFAQK